MLLADITNEQAGVWVLGLYAVAGGSLGVIWLARQLWVSFNAKPAPDAEYVTRHELAEEMRDLKAVISSLVSRPEYELRHKALEERFASLDVYLRREMEKLQEYLHQRTHDLKGDLGAISNKVESIALMLAKQQGRQDVLEQIKTKQDPPRQE